MAKKTKDARPPTAYEVTRMQATRAITKGKLVSTKDVRPLTVSEEILDRIRRKRGKKVRMHANDNISQYLLPGDLEKLEAELTERYAAVLDTLLIDWRNDHNSQGTPNRVAKMMIRETMHGRFEPMPPITDFPNASNLDQLYHVGPIAIRSMCSHHHCEITGEAHIGVFPGKKVLGLSKFARLAEWVMRRPQIQEESTTMLADLIQEQMKPEGLAVLVRCKHSCCTWRGVQDNGMRMTTSIMRGVLLEDNGIRQEFLELVKLNSE